jgi:hypothetical protein
MESKMQIKAIRHDTSMQIVEKIKDVGRKSLGIDKNFEPYPVSNGSH